MTSRLLAIALLVAACVATPRAAPNGVGMSGTAPGNGASQSGQLGAPHSPGGTHSAGVRGQSADVWYPRPAGIPGGAPPLTGTAADVTRQGIWAWADPSHGPGYLAIPEGPGWLVLVCGPAACLERTSTDAGPVKSLQRAGRLGDLSARDWQAICGVELRLGLCPGSLTLLQRPHLPETDR